MEAEPIDPAGVGPRSRLHQGTRFLGNGNPKVLVLVASYNGATWIREQLDSILAQKDVEIRVVVQDDGSSDSTLAEVGRFAQDGRVSMSAAGEPAGSAAGNFLSLIRDTPALDFDFVAFADQDDVWFPDKLSRACRALRAQDAVGYSSATQATWEDGRTAVLRQAAKFTAADFLFEGAGQGCTFVLRADFYSRVRAFVTSGKDITKRVHYHDWMVYALARSWAQAWVFDSSPSTVYRQHGGNDTGARGTWIGVRKRLHLIREGWYRGQLTAIAAVCAAAAPANPVVSRWRRLLHAGNSWRRRLRVAIFCLHSGRRKRLDNLIVTFAALAGWI